MVQPSNQPSRPKPSNRPPVRLSIKDVAFYGSLLVLAVLVSYAVLAPKPGQPEKPQASSSATTSSVPPTPPRSAPSTAAASPTATGPRIQFASLTYDFGRATGDALVPCVFTLTNTGTAPLQLHTVAPLCGCLRVGEWPRQLAPGQAGTIPVQLNTRGYLGPFAKSIRVECNDPIRSNFFLQVKGYVWRPIEITPMQAVLNLSEETPSNAVTVRLISHLEQEALVVSNLQCGLPGLAVELLTNQPGKEYHLLVKTLPPTSTNALRGRISLNTSTELMPTVEVPVYVNYLSVVSAIPSVIRLSSLPLTNELVYPVWIRSNGTNAIVVSEPTINAPGVDVQLREDQPGRQWSLTLRFPAGFDVPAGQSVELSAKVNHPKVPLIKVPVIPPPRRTGPGTPQPGP